MSVSPLLHPILNAVDGAAERLIESWLTGWETELRALRDSQRHGSPAHHVTSGVFSQYELIFTSFRNAAHGQERLKLEDRVGHLVTGLKHGLDQFTPPQDHGDSHSHLTSSNGHVTWQSYKEKLQTHVELLSDMHWLYPKLRSGLESHLLGTQLSVPNSSSRPAVGKHNPFKRRRLLHTLRNESGTRLKGQNLSVIGGKLESELMQHMPHTNITVLVNHTASTFDADQYVRWLVVDLIHRMSAHNAAATMTEEYVSILRVLMNPSPRDSLPEQANRLAKPRAIEKYIVPRGNFFAYIDQLAKHLTQAFAPDYFTPQSTSGPCRNIGNKFNEIVGAELYSEAPLSGFQSSEKVAESMPRSSDKSKGRVVGGSMPHLSDETKRKMAENMPLRSEKSQQEAAERMQKAVGSIQERFWEAVKQSIEELVYWEARKGTSSAPEAEAMMEKIKSWFFVEIWRQFTNRFFYKVQWATLMALDSDPKAVVEYAKQSDLGPNKAKKLMELVPIIKNAQEYYAGDQDTGTSTYYVCWVDPSYILGTKASVQTPDVCKSLLPYLHCKKLTFNSDDDMTQHQPSVDPKAEKAQRWSQTLWSHHFDASHEMWWRVAKMYLWPQEFDIPLPDQLELSPCVVISHGQYLSLAS